MSRSDLEAAKAVTEAEVYKAGIPAGFLVRLRPLEVGSVRIADVDAPAGVERHALRAQE